MTDILSLLEAATEGSRELDLALRKWNEANGGKESRAILHYTTNLQDAVSLVGDDVEDVKLHMRRGELSSAMIRLRGDAVPFWGKHYKLPMAICEAIIKAFSKAEAA